MKKVLYRITVYVVAVTAVIALFASCHYKDFDEVAPRYRTRVIADYSRLDYDPQYTNLRTIFFPLTAEMDMPYLLDLRDTAVVRLPDGAYRVVAFSNEGTHETYSFDGWNWSSLFISAVHANSDGLPDSLRNVYDFPDRVCSYDTTGVDVLPDEVNTGWAVNDIYLYPKEITKQVHVRLYGLKHPDKAEMVRFTLGNLPVSYDISEDSPVDSLCTMIVRGGRDYSQKSLFYGDMNIFGTGSGRHKVNVLIEGIGFKVIMTFDVTEQIERQKDKQDIQIELYTDHDLYDDIPSGFNVGVDDWKNNNIIDVEF